MFRRMVRRLFWGNADIGVVKPRRERLPEAVWEFLHALPKAEIHLHFEGATDAGTIFHLAQTHGDPDIRTLADAQWALYFREPQQFFQQFLRVSNLFRSLDDFHVAAASLGKRFVEQNILYAELTFAPHKFMVAGMPYIGLIDAIEAGLSEGVGEHPLEHRFVIDIVRDLGPEAGMRVMREVEAHPHERVVGIGLGGGENYKPEASKEVFAFAESLGLRKTAHAGEGLGPQSIWDAINHLGVERLDHGVRAREDAALVDYLAEKRIPLNLCLTSNVMLGVVPTPEDHPIRMYHERGIPVNVSTDDPTFFQTTLTDELAKLIVYQNFIPAAIPSLMENAIRASFLGEADQSRLVASFQEQSEPLLQADSIRRERERAGSGR